MTVALQGESHHGALPGAAAPRALVWPTWISSAAAFLVPGLALWLPSGYSWGALLLLLGALATVPHWPRLRADAQTWWIAAAIVTMGALWIFLSDPGEGLGRWDRPSKFLLALPCLFFAVAYPASGRALFGGLVVGCLGAGGIAVWQVFGEGLWRANGTTNAIQYGNLALQLAVMLATLTCLTLWRRESLRTARGKWWAAVVVLAVLAACLASVLSLSRGGWVALALALPLALLQLRNSRRALALVLGGVFAASFTLVAMARPEMLAERLDRTVLEVVDYDEQDGADSSIGQRIEHWRLAWDMGLEKPLLGWGMADYVHEKEVRVQSGLYRTAILEYKHVHNEVLDVFVKTGIVGVATLLFFYAVPLIVFWPRRGGASPPAPRSEQVVRLRRQELAIQLTGLSLPVMFIGFGLTQVFYAHNSGIMFYLFMMILLWSCLQQVRRQLQACRA